MPKTIIYIRREILNDARAQGTADQLESGLQDLRDAGYEVVVIE